MIYILLLAAVVFLFFQEYVDAVVILIVVLLNGAIGFIQEYRARKAATRLQNEGPANMVLLRGFSRRPDWPGLPDVYGVKAAALASYPMYQ